MAKQKKPSIPPEIKSYIDEVAKKTAAAVSDAYKPLQQPQNAKAAFKNTEARLYALPVLKVKIKDDEEKIEELRTYGTPARSKSITRFSKSSTRMDPEEALEAMIDHTWQPPEEQPLVCCQIMRSSSKRWTILQG